MSFLKVTDLCKTYPMGDFEVQALIDVNFTIEEGEFVVILGPSGSGKSTLLNILGGMDMPTKGDVQLKDTSLLKLGEKGLTKFRRDHVGFVFQFYNLMSNLTALENVELATEICQSPLDIQKVLSDVGLGDRKDHFPSQMSGGEQQRVAIARAVAKNPEILLCDEPTGALDFTTGIKILKLLHQVNKDYKKTVMVITHNASIADMADRVIKMRSGQVTENYINQSPIDPEGIVW